jgi:LuxR family maltose regulon positive regulatory protein
LLAQLQGAEHRRLTLIVADSGYGKTTLLAQWGASLPPIAQAWYALRARDASAKQLERRVLAALSPFVAIHRPARSIDNALDGLERDVLVVLDDIQHLNGGHSVLASLLDHPRIHLVLASRTPPNLPLARLRLQGQAVELTAADLAFTVEEVASLGIAGDPAELWARTQGWPAAFALIEFGGALKQAGSREELYALLAEEVWTSLTPAECVILNAVAVPGAASVEFVRHLTDQSDAKEILDGFIRRGWLTVTPAGRYQCHSLFREFVLEHIADADRTAIAERTVAWLVERGEPEEAAAITPLCTLQARWTFLTKYGSLLARGGGANAIRDLLNDLAYVPNEPAEVTMMRGRLDNLAGRFSEALGWLKRAKDQALATENWRMVARTSAYEAEIYGHRGEHAKAAMACRTGLMKIDGRDPEGVAELEGFLSWFLFTLGQVEEAFETLERARALFETRGRTQQESILIRRRGAMHSTRGEIADALRWEGQALMRFRQLREPLGEGNVLMNMGETLARAGRFDEAQGHLQAALDIATRYGLSGMAQQIELSIAGVTAERGGDIGVTPSELESERDLFFWHLISSRAARRRGESHRAWRELGAAQALLKEISPEYRVRLAAEEAALLLTQGEIEAGLRTLDTVVDALWQGAWRVESYLPRLHRAYARIQRGLHEGAKTDISVLFEWRTQADLAGLWAQEAWAAVPILEFARTQGIEPVFATSLLARLAPGRHAQPRVAIGIDILGPLRVVRDGSPIGEEAFARPQVRALLGYLAMQHPRPVPATELVEALWPHAGSIEESSLYTTVSRLRRALGRDVVLKDGTGYRLTPDIEVDTLRFMRALTAQPPQWREAIDLWRGDLLADLPLAEWCFIPRDTYRNRFLEAATRYGEDALMRRDYEGARMAFERALEVDSACEPAVQGLMRVLVLVGDAPRALRLFQRFTETLKRELGLSPSEETVQLAQRLAG